MMRQRDPRMGQNPRVNASRAANGDSAMDSYGSCLFCLKRFKRRSPAQRFCGDRCRLLHWAARELVKERSSGNADGVTDLIEKLK